MDKHIVYSNPLQAWLWESGTLLYIAFGCLVAGTYICLRTHVENYLFKYKHEWYKKLSKYDLYIDIVFIIFLIVTLFTVWS